MPKLLWRQIENDSSNDEMNDASDGCSRDEGTDDYAMMMMVTADEAEWGLGPGVSQCHAGSTAKNGVFGAGEHCHQTAQQQTAAQSRAPTGDTTRQYFKLAHGRWKCTHLTNGTHIKFIALVRGLKSGCKVEHSMWGGFLCCGSWYSRYRCR